ncbi:MAG TPA: hypothetical protein VGC25_08550 [Alphaproteobacteria bacterium]|jgi:hypothetical protein
MPHWGTILTVACASLALAGKASAENPGSAGTAPGATVASGEYLSAIEQDAFSFRRLQTELMVAALSCGEPVLRDQYNAFVIRHRPALRENGRVLKAHFRRLYGRQATKRLDDHMTRAANEASALSWNDASFCWKARVRFEALERIEPIQSAGGLVREAEAALER